MSIFSKNIITNNKDSIVTIGEKNIVSLSQKLEKVETSSIICKGEKWGEVVKQLMQIQGVVKELPDNFEELRDQKLIPSLSAAKTEAKILSENPNRDKKNFIKKLKSFCDIVGNVTDVASKVAPFVTSIAKTIGIPLL